MPNGSSGTGRTSDTTRDALRVVVAALDPLDSREHTDQRDVLTWIDSGAALYRTRPPDHPAKHLVTYFVPYHAGTDQVFLVAHRKAGLLLPPGGHVEPDEDPWTTVTRECREELDVAARPHPFGPGLAPLFVTVTQTIGPAVHTDATLWFLLDLDPATAVRPDPGEFTGWGWHPRTDVAAWPAGRADPELPRFLAKVGAARNQVQP